MTVTPGRPRIEAIAQRWHDLAERRLDYYTELYRSGRWRHYYTQERFAMRMLDVIEAAKAWRALAGQRPTERQADREARRLASLQAEQMPASMSQNPDRAMRPAA